MRYWLKCTLLLAGASSACTQSDDTDAATADPASATRDTAAAAARSGPYVRGVAIRGATPRFVVCGTADTLQLIDASGTMPARGGNDELDAIFTVVSGSIEGDTSITVDRVMYASADRSECYNDWSGIDVRATGSNPGWVADVRGNDVRLRREGGSSFSWSGVQKDSTDGRVRFTAPAGSEAGAFEMILQAEPCTDVAARTLSMWSARVVVGGEELGGCARTSPTF